jgi:hypothetical protein
MSRSLRRHVNRCHHDGSNRTSRIHTTANLPLLLCRTILRWYVVQAVYASSQHILTQPQAHARLFQASLSPNITVFSDALELYSKRWALATRYLNVIRSAVDELSAPIGASLPAQFYDPQYSTCDINEALRSWEADTGSWYYNLPPLRTPQPLISR